MQAYGQSSLWGARSAPHEPGRSFDDVDSIKSGLFAGDTQNRHRQHAFKMEAPWQIRRPLRQPFIRLGRRWDSMKRLAAGRFPRTGFLTNSKQ